MLVVRNAFALNGVLKAVGDELSAEEHKYVDALAAKAKALASRVEADLSAEEKSLIETLHNVERNCVRRAQSVVAAVEAVVEPKKKIQTAPPDSQA